MNTTEMAPTAVDRDLVAMMDAVFSDAGRADPSVADTRLHYDRDLWQRLDSLGLVRLTGSERSGGSGAGWFEAAELLAAAVRHGVRMPLAEHDLLACWLLEAAGLPVDGAVRTVHVAGRDDDRPRVPWAGDVDRVVVVWRTGDHYRVADVDRSALSITEGTNLIGEPRDTVAASATTLVGHELTAESVVQLRRKSALIRAIQVCAALDRAVELSVGHVATREQFGRPLAKFQAIQHLISDAAAEAALARAATEAALSTAVACNWSSARLDFQIATARSCAGHATSVVTRHAHQLHGAIGTTREHDLHHFTRAALAWRSEYGSVRYWDSQVASAAMAAGPRQLWSLIAGGD
jgi:acyl-CoA dehydrogenase